MNTIRSSKRRLLDQQLADLATNLGPQPPEGWIRRVRDALGMTAFELGGRMGVSQPRVSQLERAERQRTIQLSHLDHAAQALQARLIYAVVPLEPLKLDWNPGSELKCILESAPSGWPPAPNSEFTLLALVPLPE